MKTFNFAIIGTGMIANKMAEALDHVEGICKYAVASRNHDKATQFANKWQFSKAYGSYKDLVKDNHVDVVYIATPHNLHCENTLMCFDYGKHVLCEKPLAVNKREVDLMMSSAKEKNLFLMEAMWTRFLPQITKAKELIDNGELGQINLLAADFCINKKVDPADRKFNRDLIGGSLLDIGIYPIFLSQYLIGEPHSFVATAGIGDTQVDYSCSMTLKYEGTKLGVVYSSFIADSGVNASVYGDKATLKFDPMWFTPVPFKLIDQDGNEKEHSFDFVGNGYNYEVDEVVDCLNKGLIESPKMSWDHSIALISLLDKIRYECGITYPGHDK